MKYISINIPTPTNVFLSSEQLERLLFTMNCSGADSSNAELLLTLGYTHIPDIQTTQPTNTSIVVADKNDNGDWFLKWIEEQEYVSVKKSTFNSNAVRKVRDKLLSQTDWTQYKDISDTVSNKWVAYRQALRDITSQEGFPDSVTWPTPPQ